MYYTLRTLGILFCEVLHRHAFAEILQLVNATLCLRNLGKLQLEVPTCCTRQNASTHKCQNSFRHPHVHCTSDGQPNLSISNWLLS